MDKNTFKRDTEVNTEEHITHEEDIAMNKVEQRKPEIPEGEIPFYYGFYSVDHMSKKGQLMDILKDRGETRKCPCLSIAVSLKDVAAMVELGYRFKNKDADVFRETITKHSIKKYINKVRNLINNGFLIEK